MTQKSAQNLSPLMDGYGWEWLYRLGGIAALIIAILIPFQIVAFIAWPPPSTVSAYFTLFQQNRLLGLVDLDLLLIVDNLLSIFLTLAIFIALRRTNPSFATAALALGMISIVLYLVSREATFSMSTLSDQYALASTDSQRQAILAAGQTLLTTYTGTDFNIGYILGAISLIIFSAVMLQNRIFSQAIAWLGIVSNVISLGLYVPVLGIYISIFSVLFLWVWDILMARRLFQLASLKWNLGVQAA
ncbi:MAG TPA: DUF4386 family protein [Anaerolineaceae bacterium]|nr:DUF4386 family protein [Anaerolineaceae bacterium]